MAPHHLGYLVIAFLGIMGDLVRLALTGLIKAVRLFAGAFGIFLSGLTGAVGIFAPRLGQIGTPFLEPVDPGIVTKVACRPANIVAHAAGPLAEIILRLAGRGLSVALHLVGCIVGMGHDFRPFVGLG